MSLVWVVVEVVGIQDLILEEESSLFPLFILNDKKTEGEKGIGDHFLVNLQRKGWRWWMEWRPIILVDHLLEKNVNSGEVHNTYACISYICFN